MPHSRMPFYENPSPGNKAGGISTLEEKSLGCTQKCGSSVVRGVLVEDTTMDELAVKFRDYVLAVASGESVNNEKHGRREIAIFKTGVTL